MNGDNERGSRILAGASSAFVFKVGGAGLAFALQVLVARSLGRAGFGTYVLALTWANVFVLFGKLGLDAASLRFLPELDVRGDARGASAFVGMSRRSVLASSTGVAAVAAAVIALVSGSLAAETSRALLAACALVPFSALLQVVSGHLQARKRVALSQGPFYCGVPLAAIVLVALSFHVLALEREPFVAVLAYAGGTALTLGLVTGLTGTPGRADATPAERREWHGVGRALLLTGAFGLVLGHADVLLLGALTDADTTGAYAAANRLARFLSFPLFALNVIVAPTISELHSSGERERLQRVVARASLGLCLFSLPLFVGVALFAGPVLAAFGEGFTDGRAALLVLLGGHAVNVLMGSVGYLLAMTGGHSVTARVLGFSALLNVLLDLVLIPRFGMLGAAWATAVTTALWNVTMYVIVRRRLGIRPSFF